MAKILFVDETCQVCGGDGFLYTYENEDDAPEDWVSREPCKCIEAREAVVIIPDEREGYEDESTEYDVEEKKPSVWDTTKIPR